MPADSLGFMGSIVACQHAAATGLVERGCHWTAFGARLWLVRENLQERWARAMHRLGVLDASSVKLGMSLQSKVAKSRRRFYDPAWNGLYSPYR